MAYAGIIPHYEDAVTPNDQFVVVQPGESPTTMAVFDQWQSFFQAANHLKCAPCLVEAAFRCPLGPVADGEAVARAKETASS